jgi:hydroxymethylpyrimidine/phosphomethylpyrimidine kinase
MRAALSIAGSDSIAGAGVQADLKTFAAFGVYGTCAITAVTAQNTTGIVAAGALEADLVTAQIEAVAGDLALHAVKTGMLANAAIVEAVAASIRSLDLPAVVVDPVFASTSGERLLDEDGLAMLRTELLPLAAVATPNLPETEALSGRRTASLPERREAARAVRDLGPRVVVITGGHGGGDEVVDLLFDGDEFAEFRIPRVGHQASHGTGCAFAAAIAAMLALGVEPADAVGRAQAFVAEAVRQAWAIGHGQALLHHFWGGILGR